MLATAQDLVQEVRLRMDGDLQEKYAVAESRSSCQTFPMSGERTISSFDPIARNAAKEADRQRDWADLAKGHISPPELAARNAFISADVDLSRWVCVRIDESAWDELDL